MPPESPSIIIVDDDNSVLRSLSRVMGAAGYRTRTFSSADEFLEAEIELSQPGCLIVDLRMPGINGLELQRKLTTNPTSYPVIFISGNDDTSSVVQAMKQGAVTFLHKPFDHDELLDAVSDAVAKHRRVLSDCASTDMIRRQLDSLTAREREVMAHVITGELNKQIAHELGIAETTVKIHRGRVMQKMGVNSVAELVRACDQAGFSTTLQ